MAHEIEQHDGVVMTGQRAWHGLGVVVEEAPTPLEALKLANLDWEVEQLPLKAYNDAVEIPLNSHVLNIRKDTRTELGVVTKGYSVIQNREMAEFCEALAEDGDVVKLESAGSIRNGAKVWMLLRGESFSVRNDEISPYACISNGFDGETSFRGTWTSVRVQCSNTLHLVIPRKESGKSLISKAGFVFRHVGDVRQRVTEAKAAMALYGKAIEETKVVIDAVAAKDIKGREDVQRFFLECYTHDFGAIVDKPTNVWEEKARKRAMDSANKVFERFDKEVKIGGANYWSAMNAYTGWLQNEKLSRIKNEEAAKESKMHSRLFGIDTDRAHHALQVALAT